MKLPEIRINYSWLLAQNESKSLAKEYGGAELYSEDDYNEWAQAYRDEWAKYEMRLLKGMQEVFGLEFYLPVIDVSLAPWFTAQSDPLIMNFKNEPDQFIDVLAHELLHVLLTDNAVYSIKSSAKEISLLDRWQKLFGERDFTELVHIPVHAGLKYLYIDVLKDSTRLERDIQEQQGNPPYKAAWEYVQEHNYQKIIEKVKNDFDELSKMVR